MYLRHTTVRKKGKTHSYWRLVRSARRGRRVVQETVAQLGELDGQGRARAGALALRITGREEQYELFEAPPGQRSEPVAVRLDQIRLERAQLARRLAQARNHQDCRDRRPRCPLAAFNQAVLAETIESEGAPQPLAQPHVAKTAAMIRR